MSGWRPEGWKSPGWGVDRDGAYESGATAMLEALGAGGVKCRAVANLFLDEFGENASWNMARSTDGKRGYLVFIPDEARP